jgi:hypothetical protein
VNSAAARLFGGAAGQLGFDLDANVGNATDAPLQFLVTVLWRDAGNHLVKFSAHVPSPSFGGSGQGRNGKLVIDAGKRLGDQLLATLAHRLGRSLDLTGINVQHSMLL